MKKDFSKLLFNKYLKLNNKDVRLVLRNGRIMEGIIVGFFRGNRYRNDPYILKWHFVERIDEPSLGIDMLGNRIGEVIFHKEIVEIYIYENRNKLIFKDN